ncbi:hypothetical protein QYF36_002788 [Acer negundo]|nr:hypothetical protein QYF36_002788 [Acer negundo]
MKRTFVSRSKVAEGKLRNTGAFVQWVHNILKPWQCIYLKLLVLNFLTLAFSCTNTLELGKVKLAAAHKLVAMVSPPVAEALAMKNGIQMASEAGWVPFQIETDSLQVVDMNGLSSPACSLGDGSFFLGSLTWVFSDGHRNY